MDKKCYQRFGNTKCLPEKNNQEALVEKSMGRSIGEMWERMVASGEMQRTMALNANRKLSKEKSVQLMAQARAATPYLTEGIKDGILRRASKIVKDHKAAKKKKAQDEINNGLIEKGKKIARDEMEAAAKKAAEGGKTE